MSKFWMVKLSRPTADGEHLLQGRDHIKAENAAELTAQIRERWPDWVKQDECEVEVTPS